MAKQFYFYQECFKGSLKIIKIRWRDGDYTGKITKSENDLTTEDMAIIAEYNTQGLDPEAMINPPVHTAPNTGDQIRE